MYGLLKFECKNPKQEAYTDAWDLRRLYTFAFKRQGDAAKRGQRPRDWGGVNLIFNTEVSMFSVLCFLGIIKLESLLASYSNIGEPTPAGQAGEVPFQHYPKNQGGLGL